MKKEQTDSRHNVQHHPVPFHRAFTQHAPPDLWNAYIAAEDRVAQLGPRLGFWTMDAHERYQVFANYKLRERQADSAVERAWAALMDGFVERPVAGELTGLVQDDPPFGPWRSIPPSGWRSMQLINFKAENFQAGTSVLLAVQIVEGRYEPPTEITGSGSPGRTTSKHLFMTEHRQRCEAGIALQALNAEAQHLAAWLNEEHPGAPGGTASTIRNNIRNEHRAWLARRQNAAKTINVTAARIKP